MTAATSPQPVPFVRRVRIHNYRSIANCDVTLGPLTVLVGFNASGKTNFLDALRLVTEALELSPAQAVESRGGLESLLHRSPTGTAESFGIWLDLTLPVHEIRSLVTARYGFEIGHDPAGEATLLVKREVGEVDLPDGTVSLQLDTPAPQSRLRLSAIVVDRNSLEAALERRLMSMRFHDFSTTALAALNKSKRAHSLGSAGEHLGRVLERIKQIEPLAKERLDAYLSALVPGALGMDERMEGLYSTVQARFQAGEDTGRPADDSEGFEVFLREELSEGTLRAAGVLAALLQVPVLRGLVALVGIEEPEKALHPAGVGALYEALDDASQHTQVIVTSQSSDLLDNEYARPEHLRVVSNVDGATRVGEIDASGRAILNKGLMTLAELHRSGQLRPDTVGHERDAGEAA